MYGVWSTAHALNVTRVYHQSVGAKTACLCISGYPEAHLYDDVFTTGDDLTTEYYNGVSWAMEANVLFDVAEGGACGSKTACILFGGNDKACQMFDGTSWATSVTMIYNRYGLSSVGSVSSALAIGGADVLEVEKFDGVSWEIGASLTEYRDLASAAGTSSLAVCFGGEGSDNNPVTSTENYDNVSWQVGPDLVVACLGHSGCGNKSSVVSGGGENYVGLYTANSQDFDVIAWQVSGNLLSAKAYAGMVGNRFSALSTGGFIDDNPLRWDVNTRANDYFGVTGYYRYYSLYDSGYDIYAGRRCEEYGIGVALTCGVWSMSADLNRLAWSSGDSSTGTKTAALHIIEDVMGGIEIFDGSSWVIGPDTLMGVDYCCVTGTPVAATLAGSWDWDEWQHSELFDGVAWAMGPSLNFGRSYAIAVGTQNDAVVAGGGQGQGINGLFLGEEVTVEHFDGAAWSLVASMTDGRSGHCGYGSSTDAVVAGGQWQLYYYWLELHSTEEYNGVTWSHGGDLSISRTFFSGASGICHGGEATHSEVLTRTDKYENHVWTNVANLLIARNEHSAVDGLSITGLDSDYDELVSTEEYNDGVRFYITEQSVTWISM